MATAPLLPPHATEERASSLTPSPPPVDTGSSVERQADLDLLEGLRAGDYCYILTSRQMGKSSLMARTAARLREEGAVIVTLDLAAFGQWYEGRREILRHAAPCRSSLDLRAP
jgi:hypothetical protein